MGSELLILLPFARRCAPLLPHRQVGAAAMHSFFLDTKLIDLVMQLAAK
jgi:hypothetical protein